MSVSLSQIVKMERIDFIVKLLVFAKVDDERRALIDEWLSDMTEDLLNDMKSEARKKASTIERLSS